MAGFLVFMFGFLGLGRLSLDPVVVVGIYARIATIIALQRGHGDGNGSSGWSELPIVLSWR